jgi:hypothetical protein
MPKLIVNAAIPGLLKPNDYVLVAVFTPDGRDRILKVNPGKEHGDWFRLEWGRDPSSKRINSLRTVDLTSEREAAGCGFMQHAFEAEKWPEGWKAYEAYMRDQFLLESTDASGNKVAQRRRKPKATEPYPENLLPKAVVELRRKAAGQQRSAVWQPPKGLVHPADRKAAQQ